MSLEDLLHSLNSSFFMEVNLIKYFMEKETVVLLTGWRVLRSLWELESFGFNPSKIDAIMIGMVFETLSN